MQTCFSLLSIFKANAANQFILSLCKHFSNFDNSIKEIVVTLFANQFTLTPTTPFCTNLDNIHQEAVNSYLLKIRTAQMSKGSDG